MARATAPATLGHYRVLEKIGEGGMGVVYRAHDEHLEREVAIKILPAGTLADEGARKRFRKEARALSRLNHPNIETVHDFDSQDGTDFLVIEYVPGATLHEKLAAGPLPEKEVAQLGVQLCEGLAAAHQQGVIHRDLKPDNVRVTAEGRLKILDFGLAKLVQPVSSSAPTDSLSEDGRFAGTLPYMAPEQVQGEKLDSRTDVWAAGAVLYEMATGRRPFRAPGARLIHDIMNNPPAPPSSINRRISPALEAVILKCLDKDPENRYQSAKELAVDLRRLTVPSAAGVVPARRRRRVSPTWSAALIALGLMIAVAVALALGASNLFQRWWGKQGRPHIESLAVLPLANLSGDPSQEYFSDGMTDSLITELAQIRALNVISRTSAVQYKHTAKALPQIAKELHVDAIIEGTIQQEDGRVAISLNLVDASDRPLRAFRLERELRDVLALQREVARTVVEEVKVTLTQEEQHYLATAPPVDPAAHEAYLMGVYLNYGTHEQRKNAKKYFEKAISVDPAYAPPYAGLADFYWAMSELDPRDAMPMAKRNAMKALELDPRLAHAHTTLASIYFYADFNWTEADHEFRRAIALYPNYAEGHRMYSVFLAAMGRTQASLEEARRSKELDAISPVARLTTGWNLYYARRYQEAVEECRGVLELDPNNPNAYECMGSAYTAMGRASEAINACERSVELSPDPVRKVGLGRAYALAHREADARRILTELLRAKQEERAGRQGYVPSFFAATLYAALGQKNEAFHWLDQAYEERDRYLAWLKVDESVDRLRSDARFESLLRRVGLP